MVRWGLVSMLLGIVALMGALEVGAGAEIVAVPLLLAGFGVGALSSQLGAVTVSAVADKDAGDVGGVQNTMTNLGASLGTAVAGSILIATLTSTLLVGLGSNPEVSAEVAADRERAAGVGRALRLGRAAGDGARGGRAPAPTRSTAVVAENESARIDALRASLAVLAVIAALALYFSRLLPTAPVGSEPVGAAGPPDETPSEVEPVEPEHLVVDREDLDAREPG